MAQSTKPARGIRKPPPAVAAEAFVAGAPPPKAEPANVGRAKRRITTYFPPELAQRLRVRAAKDDRSVTDLVVETVETFLRKSS